MAGLGEEEYTTGQASYYKLESSTGLDQLATCLLNWSYFSSKWS